MRTDFSLKRISRPVVFVFSGIGDHRLALPTLRALAALFPGTLTLICQPDARPLTTPSFPYRGSSIQYPCAKTIIAPLEEADRLRQKQVERAQYEADLARRRYMRVDPDNRLVADSLEAEWNGKLSPLTETQQNRGPLREQDRKALSDQQRAAILSLPTDLPRLWRDPNTPDRERKPMIRLLLEDVTPVRGEDIALHIRFKGGATMTLMVPAPLNAWQQRGTDPAVVKEIDRLLDHHTADRINTERAWSARARRTDVFSTNRRAYPETVWTDAAL